MDASLISKLVVAGISVTMSAGTSDMLTEMLEGVKKSVQAIELQKIDQVLMQHEVMNSIDRLKDSFPPDMPAFEKFMNSAFEQKSIRNNLKDQWGTPLRYERERQDEGYMIMSAGPDVAFETEDDLILQRNGDKINLNVNPLELIEKEMAKAIEMEKKRSKEMETLLADLDKEKDKLIASMPSDEAAIVAELLKSIN